MTTLENINSKIFYKLLDFEKLLNYYRFKNQKIVFTNGCFDLLHLGHIEYLSQAADLGNCLIIGLNSDESVKKLKGSNRPINNLTARASILASLSFVSAVVVFDEDTPEQLIKFIRPHFLVKGSDYSIDKIAGAEYVLSYGGKVETIALSEGYSTTGIEIKILNSHR